jgi:hypothetical protein
MPARELEDLFPVRLHELHHWALPSPEAAATPHSLAVIIDALPRRVNDRIDTGAPSPRRNRGGSSTTPNAARARDARWFTEQIDEALATWIGHRFRYAKDAQREEVRALFREGRDVYARMAEGR